MRNLFLCFSLTVFGSSLFCMNRLKSISSTFSKEFSKDFGYASAGLATGIGMEMFGEMVSSFAIGGDESWRKLVAIRGGIEVGKVIFLFGAALVADKKKKTPETRLWQE